MAKNFQAQKRIIIVEDELLTGLGYASALSDAGYEVLGVADRAPDAVRAAQQHRPDLVIMDISLHSRFDGIRAAREIRRTVGTPIMFISAHCDAETVERAAQVQPVAHLGKPVNDLDFLRAVNEATGFNRLH
jgi:CheY-like chemotaxis protein